MKSLSKILVAAAALFFSNSLLAQHGKSGSHGYAHSQAGIRANKTARNSGKFRREEARANGSVNANAHANENGKNRANENSVLEGNEKLKTKTHSDKLKGDDMDEINGRIKTNANNGGTKRHKKSIVKKAHKGDDKDDDKNSE